MATASVEFSAIGRVLPGSLVEEVIREAGREGQRRRKLPPELVAWLVVGMGFFRQLSIPSALQRVVDALGSSFGWGRAELPHSTSISQARDRLGWEAIRLLFRKFAERLRLAHEDQDSWRGLAVYGLDGTTARVPDTDANEHWFGRPGSSRGGRTGFPQLRAVMLVGVWTHLVVDAVFGPYRMSELRIAEYLIGRLKRGCLVLLDRGYHSYSWPALLDQHGVFFVVREKRGRCAMKLRRLRRLGSGDWLCVATRPRQSRHRDRVAEELLVRQVTCGRKRGRSYSVITNLLDATTYPAAEIAALYRDRWESELAYRELKTHLAAKQVVFRSKLPDRVLQEAYGLLVAYNAVRALMAEAARDAGLKPTRLSFLECLRRIRWALNDWGAGQGPTYQHLVDSLALCRLPPRRADRVCDRAVKIKMSSYPRRRAGKRSAPSRYQRQARGRQWRGRAG